MYQNLFLFINSIQRLKLVFENASEAIDSWYQQQFISRVDNWIRNWGFSFYGDFSQEHDMENSRKSTRVIEISNRW